MAADAEILRILHDPEADPEAAREALHALGRAVAPERLEPLLQDDAILHHPAGGVRRDAACALGALATRRPDRLIDLIEDSDVTVARAAWLSLWAITGRPCGLEEDALFAAAPVRIAEPEELRDHLFTRTGVSAAQRVAIEAMLRDDLRRADVARRFRASLGEARDAEGAWPAWEP
jgi:HEAT repeat protein